MTVFMVEWQQGGRHGDTFTERKFFTTEAKAVTFRDEQDFVRGCFDVFVEEVEVE